MTFLTKSIAGLACIRDIVGQRPLIGAIDTNVDTAVHPAWRIEHGSQQLAALNKGRISIECHYETKVPTMMALFDAAYMSMDSENQLWDEEYARTIDAALDSDKPQAVLYTFNGPTRAGKTHVLQAILARLSQHLQDSGRNTNTIIKSVTLSATETYGSLSEGTGRPVEFTLDLVNGQWLAPAPTELSCDTDLSENGNIVTKGVDVGSLDVLTEELQDVLAFIFTKRERQVTQGNNSSSRGQLMLTVDVNTAHASGADKTVSLVFVDTPGGEKTPDAPIESAQYDPVHKVKLWRNTKAGINPEEIIKEQRGRSRWINMRSRQLYDLFKAVQSDMSAMNMLRLCKSSGHLTSLLFKVLVLEPRMTINLTLVSPEPTQEAIWRSNLALMAVAQRVKMNRRQSISVTVPRVTLPRSASQSSIEETPVAAASQRRASGRVGTHIRRSVSHGNLASSADAISTRRPDMGQAGMTGGTTAAARLPNSQLDQLIEELRVCQAESAAKDNQIRAITQALTESRQTAKDHESCADIREQERINSADALQQSKAIIAELQLELAKVKDEFTSVQAWNDELRGREGALLKELAGFRRARAGL